MTTARRAVSATVPPVAVQLPVPADQLGAEAFQPGGMVVAVPVQPVTHSSRRANNAGAATVPVTACRASATRRASATALTGQSIALLGVQAQ